MSNQTAANFLFFVLLQLFIIARCATPEFHAVVITSEIIKSPVECDEGEDDIFTKVNTTERLKDLRWLMRNENVSAYIVLSNDEHQSEIVSDHDKRMKFISGFSGSNGVAVITLKGAALWTDSRYYTQAEDEVDCNWVVMRMGQPKTPTIEEWLKLQLKNGDAVSSDPKICAYEKWMKWEEKLGDSGIVMKLIEENLIDKIWTTQNGRPPMLNEPIFILDLQFAGMDWHEKLQIIRDDMSASNIDTFVVTALDEIAWTLNLRGDDIPYFPVFRSYLVIQMNAAYLYIPSGKSTPELVHHLNSNLSVPGDHVKLRRFEDIWLDLPKIAEKSTKTGLPSKYSYFSGINYLLYSSAKEKKTMVVSPALKRKAHKNPTEVAGMKACHIRDGVVVSQFLAKLEREVTAGSGNWTELKAVETINELRRKQKYNAGISFGTIAAFGRNAANAHYEPSAQTDTAIDGSSLFMLDSGGQYYDGTTDCTRTVHFGTPREIEREIYTNLLIGCIDLVTVTFKQGYTLKELEILVRSPLYERGLDYGHGTTHGIGSFLAVHETFNSTYHVNFFGSQEPGYYKENEFGMRLENIVTVVESPINEYSKNKFLTFETVTLIPYERKLIKLEMLEKKHINWLNKYHEKVRNLVGAEMLNQGLEEEYQWLLEKTEPIICT
ncbi:hypothetical protein RUM43_002214 [Polyplax serrata]|uniref:Uncharacterized protein n=1 Tax=Polyplax serrata TaxID=468196 RepID=A0AAN8S4L6_POLSC